MGKGTKEIAQIAAEWWARIITMKGMDESEDCSAEASVPSAVLIEDVINDFITHLSLLIEEKLNQEDFNLPYSELVLSCNTPGGELQKAAEYAGIANEYFPERAQMQISRNHICVISGYRSSMEYLYANKEYWKLEIKRLQEGIEQYRSGQTVGYFQDEYANDKWVHNRIKLLQKQIEECQANYDSAEC